MSLQFKFITLEVQEGKEFYIDALDLAFNALASGKPKLLAFKFSVQQSSKETYKFETY